MLNDKLFIGIITARVSASEQHKILAGIFSQAEKYNIHVAVFSNIYNFNEYHANVEVENKIYDLIESERLDGLILTAESIINQELQMRIYNKMMFVQIFGISPTILLMFMALQTLIFLPVLRMLKLLTRERLEFVMFLKKKIFLSVRKILFSAISGMIPEKSSLWNILVEKESFHRL